MPTKWLQLRVNGSKYGSGIGFEGPGVDSGLRFRSRVFCRANSSAERDGILDKRQNPVSLAPKSGNISNIFWGLHLKAKSRFWS